MKKKIVFLFAFLLCMLGITTSCSNKKNKDIISTCFAGYDFARAVAGEKMSTAMLLEPGEELHDYSPSVGDIEAILSSKVFIYIGGESDEEWVEKHILPSINTKKTVVINMMSIVKENGNVYEEEPVDDEGEDHHEEGEDHHHEEGEYDEHIWNSIKNAKLIVEKICFELLKIDSENQSYYLKNRDKYISDLDTCDISIKDVVANASKDILVFADRFPLLYFVREYNLKYEAAFSGCETAKEANPQTIERLINAVKTNNLNTIFVIELSEAKIADTIKKECSKSGNNVNVETFYTMHNISSKDYKKKVTYVDLMNRNIVVLKEALM